MYPSKRIHVATCGPNGVKTLEKLPKGWTNLHQTWHTCSDLCGNEQLPKGWTNLHQTWHTCSDLCGNEHKLNKLSLETPGGQLGEGGGAVSGSKIKKSQKPTKRLDRMSLEDAISLPASISWAPFISPRRCANVIIATARLHNKRVRWRIGLPAPGKGDYVNEDRDDNPE